MCSVAARLEMKQESDQAHRGWVSGLGSFLSVINKLDSLGAWKYDGCSDLPSWLVARYQMSYKTARELVVQARQLAVKPCLGQALESGSVSVDQLKAISVLSEDDLDAGAWMEATVHLSISELEHEARKARARKLERSDHGRYFRMDMTPDERFMSLRGQLHPEEGALVQKALDRRLAPGTSLAGFDQAYASALVDLASEAVSQDSDPDRATVVMYVEAEPVASTGLGPPAAISESAEFSESAALEPVVIPEPTLSGPGYIDSVGFVPAEVAQRLACDCRLEPVRVDKDHKPIGVGRITRTVPAYIYRQLRKRDRTCVFPGCGRHRRLHAHHVLAWARGGRTDLDNLVLICSSHHKLVHEGGWSVSGSGADLVFRDPTGRRIDLRARAPARR